MITSNTMVDGRYQLKSRLGQGGACDVWLAQDSRLGREVAVKVGRPGSDWDPDGMGDPVREGLLSSSLQHPNIVAVYDSGRHEDVPYVVMEYVPGPSLRDVLRENGPLGEADAIKMGVEIAGALDAAHRQGLTHNDVKPENILLHPSGTAKLTDFGIADRFTTTVSLAVAHDLLGTIAYLAPEVLNGEAASPASDAYALALTIYEAIAGRLPYSPTPAVAAGQRLNAGVPPLDTVTSSASRAVSAVLERQLEAHPAARFPSVGAFAEALEGTITLQPTQRLGAIPMAGLAMAAILPVGAEPRPRAPGFGTRHLVLTAATAAGGFAGLLALVFGIGTGDTSEPPVTEVVAFTAANDGGRTTLSGLTPLVTTTQQVTPPQPWRRAPAPSINSTPSDIRILPLQEKPSRGGGDDKDDKHDDDKSEDKKKDDD